MLNVRGLIERFSIGGDKGTGETLQVISEVNGGHCRAGEKV
jgi:hypothetical protein